MEFHNYSAEDFALLQEFRKWVLQPDRESNLYWESWLIKHPEKLQVLKQARILVENLPAYKHQLSTEEFVELTEAIECAIEEESVTNKAGNSQSQKVIPLNSYCVTANTVQVDPPRRNFPNWIFYAAAILLLTASVIFVNQYFDAPVQPVKGYITQSCPAGQKTQITLNDGSRVWLNAGSSIRYLEHFSENERKVFLEGEAYFEVMKDTSRPFVVYSGNIATTALGTSFNIHNYKNSPVVQVSLLTGKVQIQDISTQVSGTAPLFLTPGEAAIYHSKENTLEKRGFNPDTVLNWKNGIIEFNEASFAEVKTILERWYGVTIISENKSHHTWSYNGHFSNESIEMVLKKIALTEDLNYSINRNEVRINFNR